MLDEYEMDISMGIYNRQVMDMDMEMCEHFLGHNAEINMIVHSLKGHILGQAQTRKWTRKFKDTTIEYRTLVKNLF
jgi:hypothetical protein